MSRSRPPTLVKRLVSIGLIVALFAAELPMPPAVMASGPLKPAADAAEFTIAASLPLPLSSVLPKVVQQSEPGLSAGTIITPSAINLAFLPGAGISQMLHLTTGKTPIPKLDVLFVFDVTGSMGAVLDSAKERGTYIMNSIHDRVGDTAFGVASFCDYPKVINFAGYAEAYGAPGDYAWSLDQRIDTDITLVQGKINGLFIHNGGDGPEDYSRALFESALVNWRPGAKRVVILFGDAPAHDTAFYSRNLGVDPGVDETPGDMDDLVFTEVVAILREQGTQVIAINSDLSGQPETQRGFQYIADQTRGAVFPITEAASVPNIVVQALTAETAVIDRLVLVPDSGMPVWVKILPADGYSAVEGGQTIDFGLEIGVPEDAKPGTYSFVLTASGDGAALGVVPVTIRVAARALDPAALVAQKQDLIAFLSAPQGRIEFWDKQFDYSPPMLHLDPISALHNYESVERPIADYLKSLKPAADDYALAASLSRLVSQEAAFKALWVDHIESGDIAGRQIANAVLVGLSAIDMLRFLKRPDIVARIRGFATKIINKLEEKISAAIFDFIQYVLGQLPNADDPDIQNLRFSLHGIQTALKLLLEKDPKKTLTEVFIEGAGPLAVVDHLNAHYISRTSGYLTAGWNVAQQLAARSLPKEAAITEVTEVDSGVSVLVSSVDGRLEVVRNQADAIETAQNGLKVAADLADIATVLSTAGMITSVAAPIAKVISVLTRLLDVAGSGYLIYGAGGLWADLPDVAAQVTTTAFPGAKIGAVAGLYPLAAKPVLVSAADRSPAAWPLSETGRLEFSSVLAARTAQAVSELDQQLQDLEAAVQAGDVRRAQDLIDPLLAGDAGLTQAIRVSRAPAIAVAGEASLAEDKAWQGAYGDLANANIASELAGATTYLYLMTYLAEPTDAAVQSNLLSAISVWRTEVETTQRALEVALPMAEGHISQAIIAIKGFSLPETHAVGQVFDVVVNLSNPVPFAASKINVELRPQYGVEVIGVNPVVLPQLAANGETQVKFQVRLSEATGLVDVMTSAADAFGQEDSLRIVATEGSGGGFGLAIVLVLGLVAGGAAFVIANQQRRRRGMASGSVRTGEAPSAYLIRSGTGQSISIRAAAFTVGRGRGNNLNVPDPQVSRRHAVIRYAQGRWFIQDQDSAAGTYVNGQRVTATVLNPGDRIRIGSAEFEFRAG